MATDIEAPEFFHPMYPSADENVDFHDCIDYYQSIAHIDGYEISCQCDFIDTWGYTYRKIGETEETRVTLVPQGENHPFASCTKWRDLACRHGWLAAQAGYHFITEVLPTLK